MPPKNSNELTSLLRFIDLNTTPNNRSDLHDLEVFLGSVGVQLDKHLALCSNAQTAPVLPKQAVSALTTAVVLSMRKSFTVGMYSVHQHPDLKYVVYMRDHGGAIFIDKKVIDDLDLLNQPASFYKSL